MFTAESSPNPLQNYHVHVDQFLKRQSHFWLNNQHNQRSAQAYYIAVEEYSHE